MSWLLALAALIAARSVVEARRARRAHDRADDRRRRTEERLADARALHVMLLVEARRMEIRLRAIGERQAPTWPGSIPPDWYAEAAAQRARYLEHLERTAIQAPLSMSRDDIDAALLAALED